MRFERWEEWDDPYGIHLALFVGGEKSGMVDLSHIQRQARELWLPAGLTPIGLHESRHTFATWLDHAGVSPKLINALMGHKSTPKRLRMELEIAPIMLDRYTHVLPDALVEARDQLDAYLEKWKTKSKKAANE